MGYALDIDAAANTGRGGDLTDYSGGIVVAPIATNIGEILKPFIENSTENGGYGYDYPSRMAATSGNTTPQSVFNSGGGIGSILANPIVWIGGAAILIALLAFK